MTMKGKTAAGIVTAAAIVAAIMSGLAVHLSYRGMVHGEGVIVGASAAQIDALDVRVTRHVAKCDKRMNDVVREMGQIHGTVDAIWRHLRDHERASK